MDNKKIVREGEQERKPIAVQGESLTPEDQSWLDHFEKTQQETPKRLEDAAKFLTGIISVCLTIFLKLSNQPLEGIKDILAKGTMLFWFVSVIAALYVLFPHQYKQARDSLTQIKDTHNEIVTHKKRYFYTSVAFFIAGLALLIARTLSIGV